MNIIDGSPATVSFMLVVAGLSSSRSEALRLISSGGAYLNNRKITPPDELIFPGDFLYGKWLVLRKGKRTVRIAELCEDNGAEWYCDWSEFTVPLSGFPSLPH